MDLFHSVTLLLAIAAGAAGALLRAWQCVRSSRVDGACRALGALAAAAGLLSLVVHALAGHGASSPEPMHSLEFVANHRAYVVVPALAVAACLPWRWPRRDRAARPPGGR